MSEGSEGKVETQKSTKTRLHEKSCPGWYNEVPYTLCTCNDKTDRMFLDESSMPGDITRFESGAKSSGNIPPYECLTITFLRRCAERMRLGMHYGKHNWKKGTKDKQFILDRLNHAMEHLVNAMWEIDQDTPLDDDNLAAVAVNCMMAMEYQLVNRFPKTEFDSQVESRESESISGRAMNLPISDKKSVIEQSRVKTNILPYEHDKLICKYCDRPFQTGGYFGPKSETVCSDTCFTALIITEYD